MAAGGHESITVINEAPISYFVDFQLVTSTSVNQFRFEVTGSYVS
jgi:hypothetical protein